MKKLTETDIFLIENGKTDFKIIIPADASYYEEYAANQLALYFYRASSAQLTVVKENSFKYSAGAKFISLGETQLLKKAALQPEKEKLGACGYIVKTKEGCVYLIGGSDIGTLYSAYEFLRRQFDFEPYAVDEIRIQQGVSSKKLLDLNLTDIPDIPFRNGFGRKYYFYPESAHLLRYNVFEEAFIRDSVQPWHNTLRYFPPDEYSNRHPDWYVPSKKDLDFTANGNSEELKLLQDELFFKFKERIEQSFKRGKYCELISFTHNDHGEWAEGDSVAEYIKKYNDAYAAATLIHFINPVARRLKQYMSQMHGGRKMNIVIFAYSRAIKPPVKKQGDIYVPIDDSVVLEDNVSVIYAPINADFYRDFDHPNNITYREIMEGWKALAKNISFWIYSAYFKNYLMFFDNLGSIKRNIEIMKSYNAYYVFNESNWNYGNVAFNALKEYVTAKLLWDCSLDTESLIDDFIKNYYQDAAVPVKEIFSMLRENYSRVESNNMLPKNVILTDEADRESNWWPQKRVDDYLALFEKAYEALKPLIPKDINKYNILCDRVCAESIMFRYLELKHWSAKYGTDELERQRLRLRADCDRLNISRFSILPDVRDIVFLIKQWTPDPKNMPLHY